MPVIRIAQPSDAEAISTLLQQLGHPSTAEHIRRQLAGPVDAALQVHVLVASVEGEVAGMLAVQITPQFHQEPPLARIIDFCVSETHRGRKIGRHLIEAAERFARENQCAKLEVTAGNFRNPAHRFYERNGLVQTHRYFAKAL